MIRNNMHPYKYQMYNTNMKEIKNKKNKLTNYIYNYINIYYNYHSNDYLISFLININV